jgi:hypothetical protein
MRAAVGIRACGGIEIIDDCQLTIADWKSVERIVVLVTAESAGNRQTKIVSRQAIHIRNLWFPAARH